jgi:hypothetical protein
LQTKKLAIGKRKGARNGERLVFFLFFSVYDSRLGWEKGHVDQIYNWFVTNELWAILQFGALDRIFPKRKARRLENTKLSEKLLGGNWHQAAVLRRLAPTGWHSLCLVARIDYQSADRPTGGFAVSQAYGALASNYGPTIADRRHPLGVVTPGLCSWG